MEKKIVIARIEVVQGRENDYLAFAAPLIESSRAEAGNLCYSMYQEVQSPSEFIVYEEYVDEDAFKIHAATPYFRTFMKQVKPLLAKEIDIQIF